MRMFSIIKNKVMAARGFFVHDGLFRGMAIILSKIMYHLTMTPLLIILRNSRFKMIENRIIFESKPDFADNARALYDYMIQNHYHDRYEFVWLVDRPAMYEAYQNDHVKFVKKAGRYSGCRTLRAYWYTFSAKTIFYTHAFNWFNEYSLEKQLYVNLWHGCGYKAEKGSTEQIYFNYCLVPGDLFIKTKTEFFGCERERLLTLGYPRYDLMLRTDQSINDRISKLCNRQESDEKLILWMPTFRKSFRVLLNEKSLNNRLNLPLIGSIEDLINLDAFCTEKNIRLVIKKHYFQIAYKINKIELSNITFIDDDKLWQAGIQLYELLGHTDAIITDYSSVAVDYLLINRPIGFTLDDYEEYKESRGFVFENPLEYMPGNHIYRVEDLKRFLSEQSAGRDDYEESRRKMFRIAHNPTKHYCKRLLDFFDL